MLQFIDVPKWVLLQNYKGILEKLHNIVTILTKFIDCLSLVVCIFLKYLNISWNEDSDSETLHIFSVLLENYLVFASLINIYTSQNCSRSCKRYPMYLKSSWQRRKNPNSILLVLDINSRRTELHIPKDLYCLCRGNPSREDCIKRDVVIWTLS